MKNLYTHTHTMAEVGRDLWVHLVQLLLQQEHTDQATQPHVQVVFEDAHQRGYRTFLGRLCSATLTAKKSILMFRRNFPCFSLCLILALGTSKEHWKFRFSISFSSTTFIPRMPGDARKSINFHRFRIPD